MKAVIVLLALAYLSVPAIASESKPSVTPASSMLAGFTTHQKEVGSPISVQLFVRIPSQKLVFSHPLSVLPGTTAAQAVESFYKVEHGLVCCDSRDVKTINGLSIDPPNEKWWVVMVNGNKQNTSSRTVLKEGDTVEWVYDEKSGYDPKHIRLEDWVANVQ